MSTLKIAAQMNVPNIVSLMRIGIGLSVPLWWIQDSWVPVFAIAIAGATDGFDGWYARQYNAKTPLGVQLDPLADKLFCWLVFGYISLVTFDERLLLPFVLMVGYDIFNTAIRADRIVLALRNEYYEGLDDRGVSSLSKFKTAWLFVLMIVLVPTTLPYIYYVQSVVIFTALILILICFRQSCKKLFGLRDRNRWRSMTNSKRS